MQELHGDEHLGPDMTDEEVKQDAINFTFRSLKVFEITRDYAWDNCDKIGILLRAKIEGNNELFDIMSKKFFEDIAKSVERMAENQNFKQYE